MHWQWTAFFATFGTIFLAELGDKTQLATMSYAAKGHPLLPIFVGSALALVLTSLLGTIFGAALVELIGKDVMSRAAGILFIVLGLLTLWGKM